MSSPQPKNTHKAGAAEHVEYDIAPGITAENYTRNVNAK
jgi:hypothetical protein